MPTKMCDMSMSINWREQQVALVYNLPIKTCMLSINL